MFHESRNLPVPFSLSLYPNAQLKPNAWQVEGTHIFLSELNESRLSLLQQGREVATENGGPGFGTFSRHWDLHFKGRGVGGECSIATMGGGGGEEVNKVSIGLSRDYIHNQECFCFIRMTDTNKIDQCLL